MESTITEVPPSTIRTLRKPRFTRVINNLTGVYIAYFVMWLFYAVVTAKAGAPLALEEIIAQMALLISVLFINIIVNESSHTS